MKRVLERMVTLIMVGFILTAMLFLSCPLYPGSTQNKEINVWRKVSTEELNPGLIVPLDMSKGYAFSDDMCIYIVVHAVGEEDAVVIVFPNGGYWSSPEPDPFLEELQNEFESLEEYLKNKGGTEWKKN